MKSFLLVVIIAMSSVKSTKKIIEGIIYIDQTEEFPTGCESVTTVMCLNYHNITIQPREFIDNYLDMGDIYYKDNKKYGPDPTKKFVGSPYDSNSYGCYEPVIEKALNKIIEDRDLKKNFEVIDLTEVPLENIISEYIDKDLPVIFWATIDFKHYYINYEEDTWFIPETKKEFTWRSNEHCLLLIGYDTEEKKYIFYDPWNNNGQIEIDMDLVKMRHAEQYSMAVVIKKKE